MPGPNSFSHQKLDTLHRDTLSQCALPLLSAGGGGLEPPTNFSKRRGGDLTRVQFLEGQRHTQNLYDAGIPVWPPKLGAQIKGELMQNNITHLIVSSMQMRQHVLRHLI